MRFTTSLISAAVAALAIAAPLKDKRRDVSSLLESGNFNSNSLDSLFSSNSLSVNDIAELLSGFDLNSFNSQFSASFNQNSIEQLLIVLEGNSFGNSNLNNINDLSQFNLNAFASSFNSNFDASWNSQEIVQLLLELGLVNSNSLNDNSFFSNSEFSNSNDLSSIESEIISTIVA
ncbi:hypothetical protein BDZ45DRAFT_803970 [Acephala macrosclerotiorum]|nr:hypothetical protein BDZ45DRAFT_803970 [Acephala macrosclerotiorum]